MENGRAMNTDRADNDGQTPEEACLPDFSCMDEKQQALLGEVIAALNEGRLDLPALPDMARRFHELMDDQNVSTDKMVSLLSTDPVVSMYIVRAANSAALSNGKPVGNLRDAVLRLGHQMLRGMVVNITMSRLFQVHSLLINQQLARLWKHCREVAAISYVLAQQQRHLRAEDAMLAGLVHDIGALPFYLYADRHRLDIDQAALQELAHRSAAFIGTKLLKSWNFPDELAEVALADQGYCRTTATGKADYVDVVTLANLLALGAAKPATWGETLAAERLGYYATDRREFPFFNAEQLAGARDLLGIGAARNQFSFS